MSGFHKTDMKERTGGPEQNFQEFYGTVHTKGREDYERDNFRVLFTAVDRCLTEKEYRRLIICEGDFKSFKPTLEDEGHLLR